MPPHYLLLTAGTAGDLYPFLGLAKALQAMGRELLLIGPEFHRSAVEQAGVPFVGLGTERDYLDVVENPDVWHPRRGWAVLFRDYARMLVQGAQAVQAHAQPEVADASGAAPSPRELIVISHPLTLPGAALARDLGTVARLVNVALAPSNLRTLRDPLMWGPLRVPRWVPPAARRIAWRLIERHMIDPATVPALNAARQQLGAAPVGGFVPHIEAATDLTVTLFPPWFAPTQPDWPRPLVEGEFPLYDPHHSDAAASEPLPAPLQAFLDSGAPPLAFTPGSGHAHARAYFDAALDACARLGERALLLTRFRHQVPERLPAHALWLPYVPLAALLPRVRVLVHHGGIGTTAQALHAGTPQLVVPFAYDQFDNAARVQALGVGHSLPARRASGRRMARALAALLASPTLSQRTAAVAARFADAPGLAALCAVIEQRVPATPRR